MPQANLDRFHEVSYSQQEQGVAGPVHQNVARGQTRTAWPSSALILHDSHFRFHCRNFCFKQQSLPTRTTWHSHIGLVQRGNQASFMYFACTIVIACIHAACLTCIHSNASCLMAPFGTLDPRYAHSRLNAVLSDRDVVHAVAGQSPHVVAHHLGAAFAAVTPSGGMCRSCRKESNLNSQLKMLTGG